MNSNFFKSPLLILFVTLITILGACGGQEPYDNLALPIEEPIKLSHTPNQVIPLPEPDLSGTMTLEDSLVKRRSVRQFQDTPLTIPQIGQLVWAAQGVTHPSGLRTAPSAGALYPLEVYAATQDGLFRYNPDDHNLEKVLDHDPRPDLYHATLRQDSVRDAPLVIVITAVFSRTAQKYGETRTPQYVFLEAGHAAQNILLQAVALELGAVPIGAFYEDQITETLSLPPDQIPLYLIPVGYPE